jgi:hypothetical protein
VQARILLFCSLCLAAHAPTLPKGVGFVDHIAMKILASFTKKVHYFINFFTLTHNFMILEGKLLDTSSTSNLSRSSRATVQSNASTRKSKTTDTFAEEQAWKEQFEQFLADHDLAQDPKGLELEEIALKLFSKRHPFNKLSISATNPLFQSITEKFVVS